MPGARSCLCLRSAKLQCVISLIILNCFSCWARLTPFAFALKMSQMTCQRPAIDSNFDLQCLESVADFGATAWRRMAFAA